MKPTTIDIFLFNIDAPVMPAPVIQEIPTHGAQLTLWRVKQHINSM